MCGSGRQEKRLTSGPDAACPWRCATILNRLYRYIFSVQLVTLGLFTNAAAKPRIIPLRTSINVSSRSADIRRSVSIKSTNGTTAYILSLEPDFDIGHHLLTLELVLRRPRDSADVLIFSTQREDVTACKPTTLQQMTSAKACGSPLSAKRGL